ncbi:MAG TPA: hypothetical protein DEB40_07075 [Elusimicrobia bacterium]|nr:hypothetical protein [Elusimicrobiota bacterium]HBT61490.1 hypothetical protein [Elusimicrobiota bacterium]
MNNIPVDALASPFIGVYHRFASFIPGIAAALILLLLGLFTARALRTLTDRLFAKARLDEYTSKVGINEVLARLGMGKSPSYVLSFLVYWFVLFIFFVSSANAVNLTVVSELLERFALFLPVLIGALLILFGGLLFARFLHEVVLNAAAANSVRGGKVLAHAAYVLVVVFSAMTAMEQLGMKLSFISAAIQIMLGSVGLAAAIAFGLGGKDIAAAVLRDLGNKKS